MTEKALSSGNPETQPNEAEVKKIIADLSREADALPIKKTWGHELWIANGPLYCGKMLFIEREKSTSIHFHILKTETIYVHEGEVKLTLWVNAQEYNITLGPGDSYLIRPGVIHRFTGLADSTMYEFSTEHFDSDSYRYSR